MYMYIIHMWIYKSMLCMYICTFTYCFPNLSIHQIRVNEMHDIHRLFNDIHLDTVNEKIILAAMLGVYFVQSSMEKRC